MKVLNKFLKNGTGNYVEGVVNGRTGSGPVRSTSCETPHDTFKIASRNIGTMRQIKWDSWNHHEKECWPLLRARGQVERCFGKTQLEKTPVQVFLGWQQPRHKWRWCAPGWEVGRQSVWHQTSVGQNHVDQI